MRIELFFAKIISIDWHSSKDQRSRFIYRKMTLVCFTVSYARYKSGKNR